MRAGPGSRFVSSSSFDGVGAFADLVLQDAEFLVENFGAGAKLLDELANFFTAHVPDGVAIDVRVVVHRFPW